MRDPGFVLALLLFAGLAADAAEVPVDLREHIQLSEHLHLVEQPIPDFPKSELIRGREGWVLLSYAVLEDGSVFSPAIEASSGSEAFNEAAIPSFSNCSSRTIRPRCATTAS
jgi:TonB family protein